MKTRAQRALEITQKWSKVDPQMVSECSPGHIRNMVQAAKNEILVLGIYVGEADLKDERQQRYAANKFEWNLFMARNAANKGGLPGDYLSQVKILVDIGLIDICDFMSAENEVRHRQRRYFERQVEALSTSR